MSGFGFGAPWVLLAALALAAPFVAHLARHEDRAGRAFPSLMFLRQMPVPQRSRRKLTDRVLLALRMLAVIALVLSFARPYLRLDDATAATPQRARVVLLDRSYSMGSGERFQRARAAAEDALRVGDSSTRVALVVFDTGASTLSDFGGGSAAALQALATVRPGPRATDVSKSLAHASRMLAGTVAATRELILISDLQSSGLGNAPSLASNIELQVQGSDDEVANNLAVLAAWYDPSNLAAGATRAAGGAAITVHVRVANTGAHALSSSLRVLVDGLPAAPQAVSLAAGRRAELAAPIFAAREQLTRVQVMLADDALAIDNVRYLAIAPPRPVNVLWIAGSARGNPYVNAALSLSSAGRPDDSPGHAARHARAGPPGKTAQYSLSSRGARLAVRRADASMIDAQRIDEADVIVLDGVLADVTRFAEAIERRVAQGAGLLTIMNDARAAAAQIPVPGSTALAEPLTNSLTNPLAGAVAGVPRAAPRAASDRAATLLSALSPDHPIALALGDASLSGIAVWRYRSLQPRSDDRVLLSFGDGAPAMLERAHGSGRSATLALSLQPQASNLVLDPVFVPWLFESLLHLSQRNIARTQYAPGDVLDAQHYADTLVGGAAMTRALRAQQAVQLRAPAGGVQHIVAEQSVVLDEPGFYELRAVGVAPLTIAVNTLAAESLLDALSVPQFLAHLRRTPALVDTAPLLDNAARAQSRMAWWLFWLAVIALLAEALLGASLARRRLTQAPAPSLARQVTR